MSLAGLLLGADGLVYGLGPVLVEGCLLLLDLLLQGEGPGRWLVLCWLLCWLLVSLRLLLLLVVSMLLLLLLLVVLLLVSLLLLLLVCIAMLLRLLWLLVTLGTSGL